MRVLCDAGAVKCAVKCNGWRAMIWGDGVVNRTGGMRAGAARGQVLGVLAALLLGAAGTVATAGVSEPLAIVNHSPLVAGRALPRQRAADIREGLSLDVDVTLTSHFIEESTAQESLFLDGETQTFTLDLRYGLSDRWDIGLTLPHRRHGTGFLDGMINDWHDFFALPDGGRSQFPKDVLAYVYDGPGGRFSRQTAVRGLADPTLETSYALAARPGLALTAVLGLQWDHGEPEALTGSGGNEGFVALRFSGEHRSQLPLTWHGQLGYSSAERSEPLPRLARRGLWFIGLGVDWQLAPHWSLLAQFDGHEAPFVSELGALGDHAGLLSLGLRWRATPNWSFELGFSEDVLVETAPDISFFGRLRYRPGD